MPKKQNLLKDAPLMGRANIKNLPGLVAAGIITPEQADQIRKQHEEKQKKGKK
jgi:hypothetical protein